MNALIICSHGIACDKIKYTLDKIYKNEENYYDIADNVFEARSKMHNHIDIVIADYNLEGCGAGSGMVLLQALHDDVRFNIMGLKSVLLYLKDDIEEIENFQRKHGHWFRILNKNFDIEDMKIALR